MKSVEIILLKDQKCRVKIMDSGDYKKNFDAAFKILKENRLIANGYEKELLNIEAYIKHLEATSVNSELYNEIVEIRKTVANLYCRINGHTWCSLSNDMLATKFRYTTATAECSVCGIANDCV